MYKRQDKYNKNYRNKIKTWTDSHIDSRINLAEQHQKGYYKKGNAKKIDEMNKKISVLSDEKDRRLNKNRVKKVSTLNRSQRAISNMYKYWQKQTSNKLDRDRKLEYYSKLSNQQMRLGRKLSKSERKSLYTSLFKRGQK